MSLINIFQPGLKYGAEKCKYNPNKRYFYIESDTWRVYIRNVAFLHEEGDPDKMKFLVVKDTGSSPTSYAWEPPKGQMEGKDGLSKKPLLKRMASAMKREIEEEAKITVLKNIQYTGLVVQSREPDYSENTYFQYHIFRADVPSPHINAAFEKFAWFKMHPAAFKHLKKDSKEKDELAWFDPKSTRLYGRWSPSIVSLYLENS
jgi:8-oxo-dGTP pyrophosphatase MutT (NUDIX family)